MSALTPLETLRETKRGQALRLPPTLARLYGTLRMPLPHGRPHIISNFVTTLDGVVSLNVQGHASGGGSLSKATFRARSIHHPDAISTPGAATPWPGAG